MLSCWIPNSLNTKERTIRRLSYLASVLVLMTLPDLAQNCDPLSLPDRCGQKAGMSEKMTRMRDSMQSMSNVGAITDTQKALHRAMQNVNGPMMMGMMAEDADVAWICAMIPHHHGAIEMARAGLVGADDPESRELAEETIRSNQNEIKKLEEW
jgi:hypothetical protein